MSYPGSTFAFLSLKLHKQFFFSNLPPADLVLKQPYPQGPNGNLSFEFLDIPTIPRSYIFLKKSK